MPFTWLILRRRTELFAKLRETLVKHISIVRIDNSRSLGNLPSHLGEINREIDVARFLLPLLITAV